MTSFHFLIIFLAAMFVVPWLFEKFGKPNSETQDPRVPVEKPFSKQIRKRKSRTNIRSKNKIGEVEYPEYDPDRNDEQSWTTEIEPKNRNFRGQLPPDWQRRRALAYLNDNGKCQRCGRRCGHLACEPQQIWNFKQDAHLLYEADVHHVHHRVAGGTHSFENLALYCLRCHSIEHPESEDVWARRAVQGLGGGNPQNCFRRKAPPPSDGVPF